MNRWLTKQIGHLRSLEWYADEGDLTVFQEVAEIVRDTVKTRRDGWLVQKYSTHHARLTLTFAAGFQA